MNNIKTFENFNNEDIFAYIGVNNIRGVKNYIDSGYDLSVIKYNGNTVLIEAAFYNTAAIIELL